jgi:hypothetical protein
MSQVQDQQQQDQQQHQQQPVETVVQLNVTSQYFQPSDNNVRNEFQNCDNNNYNNNNY